MDRGSGEWAARWPVALRWLGSPVTILALVVLVLNDHVWKGQWPGVVTGKVSDVAWLVVAPPLAALVLALAPKVRRPERAALWLTGVVFLVVKATPVGAAAASAVLSWFTPSYVRHDLTDLFALPALLLAGRAAAWATREGVCARRRVTLAIGALVLPAAVLGTAATSPCMGFAEVRYATAVTGRLSTTPPGWSQDVVVYDVYSSTGLLTVVDGQLVGVDRADLHRLNETSRFYDEPFTTARRQVCSTAQPQRCWRLPTPHLVRVEASEDGGRTWRADYAPTAAQREKVVSDLGELCGKKPVVDASDLAVVDTDRGPVVVVPLLAAGAALRSVDGTWTRIPEETFPHQTPDLTWDEVPRGRIRPVDPVPTLDSPRPAYGRVTPLPRASPPAPHGL